MTVVGTGRLRVDAGDFSGYIVQSLDSSGVFVVCPESSLEKKGIAKWIRPRAKGGPIAIPLSINLVKASNGYELWKTVSLMGARRVSSLISP